jgi:FecR protein/Ankyrin repeat
MVNYKSLVSLAFISLFASAAAWGGVAHIEAVGKGSSVTVVRKGAPLKLHKGDELQVGDEIDTDAQTAADLRLDDDDTLIRVGVNSSYKLEESSQFKTLLHRLLKGAVRVLVKKNYEESKDGNVAKVPADGVKFRLYTPEGTVGVRGTEFVVARTGGNTELSGISGEVSFGPADTAFTELAKFVKVGRGFRSSVAAGGAPSKPVNFALDPFLKQLDGKDGSFGPLAFRAKTTNVKQRAEEAEAAPNAPAPSLAAKLSLGAEKPKAPLPQPAEKPTHKVDYQQMLTRAADDGNVELAQEALAHGANINGKVLGYTPMHFAVLNYKEKNDSKQAIIQFLFEKGADVNAKDDKDGRTPLMLIASEEGKDRLPLDLAKGLVAIGADLDATDNGGNTALAIARNTHYAALAAYLEKDAIAEAAAAKEALAARAKQKR